MAEHEHMTALDAARQLGLSPTRVLGLIGQGRLPAERVGRQWILKRSDVEAFKVLERRPGRPRKPSPA